MVNHYKSNIGLFVCKAVLPFYMSEKYTMEQAMNSRLYSIMKLVKNIKLTAQYAIYAIDKVKKKINIPLIEKVLLFSIALEMKEKGRRFAKEIIQKLKDYFEDD